MILRGSVSLSSAGGAEAMAGAGAVLGTWPVLLDKQTPFRLEAVSVVLAYGLPRRTIEVRLCSVLSLRARARACRCGCVRGAGSCIAPDRLTLPQALATLRADRQQGQAPFSGHAAQGLMGRHQCVVDGAWQACAASMMLAHGHLGFNHLRFNELTAMFRSAGSQLCLAWSLHRTPVGQRRCVPTHRAAADAVTSGRGGTGCWAHSQHLQGSWLASKVLIESGRAGHKVCVCEVPGIPASRHSYAAAAGRTRSAPCRQAQSCG